MSEETETKVKIKKASFYAPNQDHYWILLDKKEHRDLSDVVVIDGRFFVIRNYAGQCWGYEVEKKEELH
jgi:hypothetical protein